jgi:hypothetical protein
MKFEPGYTAAHQSANVQDYLPKQAWVISKDALLVAGSSADDIRNEHHLNEALHERISADPLRYMAFLNASFRAQGDQYVLHGITPEINEEKTGRSLIFDDQKVPGFAAARDSIVRKNDEAWMVVEVPESEMIQHVRAFEIARTKVAAPAAAKTAQIPVEDVPEKPPEDVKTEKKEEEKKEEKTPPKELTVAEQLAKAIPGAMVTEVTDESGKATGYKFNLSAEDAVAFLAKKPEVAAPVAVDPLEAYKKAPIAPAAKVQSTAELLRLKLAQIAPGAVAFKRPLGKYEIVMPEEFDINALAELGVNDEAFANAVGEMKPLQRWQVPDDSYASVKDIKHPIGKPETWGATPQVTNQLLEKTGFESVVVRRDIFPENPGVADSKRINGFTMDNIEQVASPSDLFTNTTGVNVIGRKSITLAESDIEAALGVKKAAPKIG